MVNLYSMDKCDIVRWQYNLVHVNTKESVFPVCDNPYHINKRILLKWEDIAHSPNYALDDICVFINK